MREHRYVFSLIASFASATNTFDYGSLFPIQTAVYFRAYKILKPHVTVTQQSTECKLTLWPVHN
jgi:hypothetical protein